MLKQLDDAILEKIVGGVEPDVVQVSGSAMVALIVHNPNFQIVTAGGNPPGITIFSLQPSINAAVTMEKMS